MKDNKREAERWLKQAENNLQFAELGFREGFFAQVCFQCQQICEKALKSMHYGQLGKRAVFGHSLMELGSDLDLDEELRQELAVLDQYYIPTRYPNGLPGALPYEVYNRKQAQLYSSSQRQRSTSARRRACGVAGSRRSAALYFIKSWIRLA